MSAKLEQPISPSFNRMISLLEDDEKTRISKTDLIDLEEDIMRRLKYEFHFPGPIAPMERFLRLLGYHKNVLSFDMAFNICKFQLTDPAFLEYTPSEIAACAVILAVNIYQKENQKKLHNQFFKIKKNGCYLINDSIWNEEIQEATGMKKTHLKKCLTDLAKFIQLNLNPNRLHGFYFEE